MPEDQENHALENQEAAMSRRQFFIKIGAASLGVAGVGACVSALDYLSPNVLYEPSPVVDVGKPEQFPSDSVTLEPRYGIYVVRLNEGFYAMSAICSHLGCLSAWKSEAGIIACPCHGSAFKRNGAVIAGPAPRPLPWLKMWVNDEGNLLIDRATIIPAQSQYVRT